MTERLFFVAPWYTKLPQAYFHLESFASFSVQAEKEEPCRGLSGKKINKVMIKSKNSPEEFIHIKVEPLKLNEEFHTSNEESYPGYEIIQYSSEESLKYVEELLSGLEESLSRVEELLSGLEELLSGVEESYPVPEEPLSGL